MKESVRIRPVKPEDQDGIVRITEAEFPAVASIDARIERMIGGTPWSIIKAERVRHELARYPEACAVAEIGGELAGYVTCTIDRTASRGTIANLAVSGRFQGHGLGTQLIEWAIARFRSEGLQQAKIETLATNEVGQHLYPKLGFQEVVRQVHYIMKL
jgi:ribosomal protein S18 acetylase RimI-like enzyme